MNEAREQAERAADRIRDELLVTLKELDRRRQAVTDIRYQLRQHRTAVLVTAGGLVVAVGGLVTLAVVKRRRSQRFGAQVRYRWEGLRRAWRHPERLASRAKEEPAAGRLVKKLAVVFGTAFGSRLIKQAAVKMVPVKRGE
jgi:hypothetical protein